MLIIHLTCDARCSPSFYRLELGYTLFGEYSVQREWGKRGKRGPKGGHRLITLFSNLRDACLAAERWHRRAEKRGYRQDTQAAA